MKLVLNVTLGLYRYLEELQGTGLYGTTVSETAERLISQGLDRLCREGILKLPKRQKRTKKTRVRSA